MTQHRGRDLEQWMTAAEASDLRELRSLSLACAATTTPPAPGSPSRTAPAWSKALSTFKMLKRQMYGRANLGLLRRRILLAD
jgi:hypothetical protein